jgi:hypothetical protein
MLLPLYFARTSDASEIGAVSPLRTGTAACELQFSRPEALDRFKSLDQHGQYSVQFIATVMELLAIEEKTGFDSAFMFRGVLQALAKEKDIFGLVSATHNGRV